MTRRHEQMLKFLEVIHLACEQADKAGLRKGSDEALKFIGALLIEAAMACGNKYLEETADESLGIRKSSAGGVGDEISGALDQAPLN